MFINFPVIAVGGGAVHVVWPQQALNPDLVDIVSATSTDGLHFSAPLRINDNSNVVGEQPAAGCDEQGLLVVTWMDSRKWGGSSNKPWKIFSAFSRDRGTSFSKNVDLGPPLFAGNQGIQEGAQAVGEFNGVAARAGRVYAVWTDTQSGDPAVSLAAGTISK